MIHPRRYLDGIELLPVGLGAMPMSTSERAEEGRSIRTIHAALDAGVNLIDTADAYSRGEPDVGTNERLVARALAEAGAARRDGVVVATKGGHVRPGGAWELDGRPEHLRVACEASLRALGTDRIDLYQLHRPDPAVPYAESVGALRDLRDEGKIRWVGLSNANLAQLEEARGIVEIAAVQNQLSLGYRHPIGLGEVAACAAAGILFLAWSPLGGVDAAARAAGEDAAVAAVAARRGVSPQRVALAWILSLGATTIPIPGATRPETALDSAAAAGLELTEAELASIGVAA